MKLRSRILITVVILLAVSTALLAVLLAIFHPLPISVLKEPLLEGASQHPPVRDRFLLCRLFVRVGFLFRCGLGMGDA